MERVWQKTVVVSLAFGSLVACGALGFRVSRQIRVSYLLAQWGGTNQVNAERVLQKMGIKAVPGLLMEASRREPCYERIYGVARSELPASVQHMLPMVPDRRKQRLSALRALSLPEVASDAAVPGLTRLLDDPDGAIRLHAVMALGRESKTNALAVAALIRALKDNDASKSVSNQFGTSISYHGESGGTFFVRENAAGWLGRTGIDGRAAVPQLREMLKDTHTYARQQAAIALWRINRETNVIPVLITELSKLTGSTSPRDRSLDDFLALNILKALGEIGPPAQAAVPEIRRKLEESGQRPIPADTAVREEARHALAQINPEVPEKLNVHEK